MGDEDHTESSKERKGGVDVDGIGGDMINSVLVGGDVNVNQNVIQNIVVVGKFLDFVKFEKLVPESDDLPDFKTVNEAFETTFSERLGSDFVEATAAAGAILRKFLEQWSNRPSFAALPFREILSELPEAMYKELNALDYWDSFIEKNVKYEDPYSSYNTAIAEVIWLHSLSALWHKHYNADNDKTFGLGSAMIVPIMTAGDVEKVRGQLFDLLGQQSRPSQVRSSHMVFSSKEQEQQIFLLERQPASTTEAEITTRIDTSHWDSQQFRIFMVGFVLDLIRLGSEAATDRAVWGDLIDLISPDDNT